MTTTLTFSRKLYTKDLKKKTDPGAGKNHRKERGRIVAKVDLTQYGITGTTEIIHNPSYEELFKAEMDPTL